MAWGEAHPLPLLIARFGPDLRHLFVNAASAVYVGRSQEECVGRTMGEVGTPSPVREQTEERLREVFREERSVTFETTLEALRLEVQLEPERDAGGGVASVLVVARDVTTRWQMIHALRESERLHAQAEAIAHMGSWRWDADTGAISWSDELYRIYGYEPGDPRATPEAMDAQLFEPDLERIDVARRHALSHGEPWQMELRIRAADGTTRVIESRGRPRHDAAGRIVGLEGSAQDVTDRAEAEATLRAVAEQPLAGVYVIQDGRLTYVNRAFADVFGYTPAEIIAMPGVLELVAPVDRDDVARRLASGLASGAPRGRSAFRGLRRDGTEVDIEVHGSNTEVGGRRAVVGILLDVSERRAAERALHESEERFRLVARAANDIVYDWNVVTGAIWWSEALGTVLGYPHGEAGWDIAWWESSLHPDDRARVMDTLSQAIGAGRPWSAEYRFRRRDGGWATVLDRGYAILGADGRPSRMIGSIMDISEREALAAQIRHAQKMEAVGRLAGGIAHDFNNVLTAILSTTELALAELEPGHPVHADLEEIRAAGGRAAALTRQLLAFSRRQVLQPQLLDPNDVVAGAEQLLRRLLGAQIGLEVVPRPEAGLVRADRGQLEQVLVNLAVNARDAMPRGGRLSIAVDRHVEPPAAGADAQGAYVAISVRDDGVGMDEPTLARAFEPFFTTKPVGHGTGLGLAMVYGIAQQSGGFVRAGSTPGAGTTVTLYLPEHPRSALPRAEPPAAGEGPPPGRGDGTILLAEDEAAVRRSTRRMLEQAGYLVIEAEDGVAALELFARHAGQVRLVLSDVVMPRMGGAELAARLRALGAGVPVLFMSGYDERPAGSDRAGEPAVLAKPFGQHELLAAVRAAMPAAAGG